MEGANRSLRTASEYACPLIFDNSLGDTALRFPDAAEHEMSPREPGIQFENLRCVGDRLTVIPNPVTGWVSLNAAGTQMSASFINKTYSVQPNCSIRVTFSMKINELPGNPVIGPFQRTMAPVFKPGSLELHMIWQGSAPGASTGAAVDSGFAYRIA